jgi:hypothetical protein
VWTPAVIEAQVTADRSTGLADTVVGSQIDLLVLDAAPQALDEHAGVWFRRARLLIVSPDSAGTACPLSGRNSTYRPVQISEASSQLGLAD